MHVGDIDHRDLLRIEARGAQMAEQATDARAE
jgi:hypothetical protein